jgi:LacI family transcriptional regulator
VSSIHDVARQAGVSIATVSRVLNGVPGTRDTTRERVLSIARQLNYRPDTSARNLIRRGQGRGALAYAVGIVALNPTLFELDPFSAEMLAGMEAALRERGFGTRLIHCAPEGDLPPMLRDAEVDGVLCFGWGAAGREIAVRIPTVSLDNYDSAADAYGVIPDYRAGVHEATARLLAAGHRRIAVLTGRPVPSPVSFSAQVFAGCTQAHEEAGRKLREEDIHSVPGNPAAGYAQGRELFRAETRPDAVIASDGAMPGLFRAAYEAGLRIPQDISFVGVDGVAAMEFLWPPLTTVDTHIRQLGQVATHALTQMILTGERRRGVEIAPVTFIPRASARLGSES